jgi:hypothetical protein
VKQARIAGRTLAAAHALAVACACSRPPAREAVEPVALEALAAPDTALATGTDAATAPDANLPGASDVPPATGPDATPPSAAPAKGGLWVVDAAGKPVGLVVQRGHPGVTQGGGLDVLRDGVLVYAPQAGLFFGLAMASGKVIAPRLGVADTSCGEPVVAGYYTEGELVSGQGYAFVYDGKWFRVKDFVKSQLVPCGGTVSDGPDPKCAPHSGSCRGFPVVPASPPLPAVFPAPMAFAWLPP